MDKKQIAEKVLAGRNIQSLKRSEIIKSREEFGNIWFMVNSNEKVGKGEYKLRPEFLNIPNLKLVEPPFTVKENDMDIQGIVPSKESNFVSFGVFSAVSTIVKSEEFFPTYITGPSGNGKSTAVKQACAVAKRGFIRVNLNAQTDEEMLIGSKTLVDGNVQIVDGPAIIAMRTGSILLLDECDAGSANSLLAINSILEGGEYYFKLKNEWVKPERGFNIIATANTKGRGSQFGAEYVGTNVLNEAFLERFAVTLEQDYPTNAMETKILEKHAEALGINAPEFIANLVVWSDAIHATYANNGVSDMVTTRRLIHILRAYKMFDSIPKALEYCLSRFDVETKKSFIDLYNKLSAGVVQAAPIENVPEIPF